MKKKIPITPKMQQQFKKALSEHKEIMDIGDAVMKVPLIGKAAEKSLSKHVGKAGNEVFDSKELSKFLLGTFFKSLGISKVVVDGEEFKDNSPKKEKE